MNDLVGATMKSGFPFLLLTLVAMLLVSLWRQKTSSRQHKWRWTLIMILPSLLCLLILAALGITPEALLQGLVLGVQPFSPPWPPFAFKAFTYSLLFLPFSGILAWLLLDR